LASSLDIIPPLGLLGLDEETSKSPYTRLQNGHDARRLLWTCLQEDSERSMERAIVKGLVDGNPPYNDSKRRSEGRGWECNLNFMEGQAIMDASAVPYFALFANVPYYADCRTAYQPDNPDHESWCSKITYCFSNLLKRWPEFNWNVQQCSYWMRLHGPGPAYFDRDGDWRFRAIETANVLFPRGSPSCVDERIPFIIIRVPYRIVELWDRIKDEEAATAAGWNVSAVKNAIKFGMKGLVPNGSEWWAQSWEYYQRILKNNDLTASFTDSDLVNCSHILVQEFAKPGEDAKISKFIFTDHQVVPRNQNNADTGSDKQFLFSDPNCYDNFQQALIVFFQNTGDGTYHSVRGIAMRAFKHLEVSNRLKGQAVNRAFLDSSLVLQTQTGRGRERLELSVWGSVVRLPTGAEFKPTTVQGGTESVLEVDRMLTNHLANNIGMFNQRTLSREDGKGEMPTATQVNQQVAKESTLSEGQITLFYQYLDTLYSEMFRRAADPSSSDEEAKRFQKELRDDGVPKQALSDMEYVRANRQSGYGSPQMALLKQQQMMAIVPMLPEQGKSNWLEDAVTTIEGPEKTNRYAPRQYIPDQDDSIAALENGLIQEGRSPVIATGQDDVVHLTSHLRDAGDTLSPIQQAIDGGQQLDPAQLQDAYEYSQVMIPHVEAHIARLQNDPMRKDQGRLFQDQFRQLTAFDGKLRAELFDAIRQQQVQMQQQQQATALSALDSAKVQSVQTQTALATQKTQSQIQNQALKTVHGIRQKAVKQAADIQFDAAKTAADIRNQRNKALTVPSELSARIKTPKEAKEAA